MKKAPDEDEGRFWSQLLGVQTGPPHAEVGLVPYFRTQWKRWRQLAGLEPVPKNGCGRPLPEEEK